MKDNSRKWIYITAGLLTASFISACCGVRIKNAKTIDAAMLLDEAARPTQHALIRPQERPVFHIDDRKRPFAMIDDRGNKIRSVDKPIHIQEFKP